MPRARSGKRYQTTQELADELAWLERKWRALPVRRVVGMRLFAAAVVLAWCCLAAPGGSHADRPTPVQHEPVIVLIADFQNQTNDPSSIGRSSRCSSSRSKAPGSSAPTTGTASVAARRAAADKLDEAAARRDRGEAGAGRRAFRFGATPRRRLRNRL